MNPSYYYLMATTLLGTVGVWLLLPRRTPRGRALGGVLASVALGIGASQLPFVDGWAANGLFGILACVTIISAVGTISFRNPVYCALWFGLMLLGIAGLFLYNGAQFLAVATIVVYAGAILVTFLFVLMLAQPEGKAVYDRVSWESLVSAATGMLIVGILSMSMVHVFTTPPHSFQTPLQPVNPSSLEANVLNPQHVATLGTELFGKHLLAVEIAGTLLLAALVGAAAIIAQGKIDLKEKSPPPQKNSDTFTSKTQPL